MFGTEQKVGLFVVVSLILLGIGTFVVGDLTWFEDQERAPYTARISDVKGLREQAPVRIAGVEVGKVEGIRLADGQARVRLRIREGVRLPESTRATVGGTGLVGEKYLILKAEAGDPSRLEPGATIPEGARARDMDDLMRTFGKVGEEVQELTSSLREVFGDEEGQRKLQKVLDNVNALSADLKGIAAENREGIRKVVANLESVTAELRKDLPETVREFERTAEGARKVISENRENLQALIAKLRDTSENLAEITGNVREGEGTIGKLYKEDKVYADLSRISENLNDITTKINEGEGALGKLVSDKEVGKDLESAVAGLGEYSGRLQRLQTSVSMDNRYLTEQEVSKTDFNVRLQTRPTRYYLLGVTSDGLVTQAEEAGPGEPLFGQDPDEYGNEFKFTFMFGRDWPAYNLSGRIGLFQSSGGLGMSYYPWRSVELSADLWDFGGGSSGPDFDGPQSRFMARYSFLNDHLLLEGGVHNAFSDELRSPFVGLGLRFFDEDLKYLAGSVPTGGL